MRFSNITLFAFSATALAIPVTEQAQTDVEVGQEDFSIFDCSIVGSLYFLSHHPVMLTIMLGE